MKKVIVIAIAVTGALLFGILRAAPDDIQAAVSMLEGLSAKEAMDVANTWRWESGFRGDVWSYVDPNEVVFVFNRDDVDKRKIVRIPLPEDEMLVSIMPYINNTHS